MAKLYGSLDNRFEEGKNYTHREIKEGDDITMYYWSDRHCYYITKVVDQKHIFVREYEVVADREQPCMSNSWKYFKTKKECNKYLNEWFDKHPEDKWDTYQRADEDPTEAPEEEWAFRNNKWKEVVRWNPEKIAQLRRESSLEYPSNFTDRDIKKICKGEDVLKYRHLEPVSFGIRDYYYDYEF